MLGYYRVFVVSGEQVDRLHAHIDHNLEGKGLEVMVMVMVMVRV